MKNMLNTLKEVVYILTEIKHQRQKEIHEELQILEKLKLKINKKIQKLINEDNKNLSDYCDKIEEITKDKNITLYTNKE